MAARLRPKHQLEVREKIRATQLVNRLSNHVLGKVKMSPTQVRAAEILLKKCVPDLASMEHTGKDGGPLQFEKVVREIIDPKPASK